MTTLRKSRKRRNPIADELFACAGLGSGINADSAGFADIVSRGPGEPIPPRPARVEISVPNGAVYALGNADAFEAWDRQPFDDTF